MERRPRRGSRLDHLRFSRRIVGWCMGRNTAEELLLDDQRRQATFADLGSELSTAPARADANYIERGRLEVFDAMCGGVEVESLGGSHGRLKVVV